MKTFKLTLFVLLLIFSSNQLKAQTVQNPVSGTNDYKITGGVGTYATPAYINIGGVNTTTIGGSITLQAGQGMGTGGSITLALSGTNGGSLNLNPYGGKINLNGFTNVAGSLTSDGKVGIGIHSPTAMLHINDVAYTGVTPFFIEHYTTLTNSYASLVKIDQDNAKVWAILHKFTGTTGGASGPPPVDYETFYVYGNGNLYTRGKVGIGVTDTKGYSLAINGPMIATKVIVKQYLDWPDFVFSENHKMKTLTETAEYIKANKHLPDVPTEVQVKEKGIDVGELNTILLRKVEEITLLLIEQNKTIETLKIKVDKLENK